MTKVMKVNNAACVLGVLNCIFGLQFHWSQVEMYVRSGMYCIVLFQ